MNRDSLIATLTAIAIACHLILRFALHAAPQVALLPLYAAIALGGAPLIWTLVRKLLARDFGSDLLAGVAIVSASIIHEYLVPKSLTELGDRVGDPRAGWRPLRFRPGGTCRQPVACIARTV